MKGSDNNILVSYKDNNVKKLFNQITGIKISYTVPKVGERQNLPVVVKVYDCIGNEIAKLENGAKSVGIHEVDFDVAGLKRGTYFYQVYAGSYVSTKKMIEIR